MTKITATWLTSPASQSLFRCLADAGYQVWFVGGCVRNALLDAPVRDLDVATNAHPDQVMKLTSAAGFRTIPTGIDHGTVTVIVENTPYEITTFRRDVATDGRRAVVAFSDNMRDDALRRDFTMNALYAGADGVVVDPLDGLSDLLARRVRFIENAAVRIQEDYLRILRFFRFHAWYGDLDGGIDPDGLAACAANVDGIDGLSKERIGSEMLKLLAAPDPAPSVASMAAAGVLMRVLAGASPNLLPVLVHVEENAMLAPDPLRRLAVLGGENLADSLRLSRKEVSAMDTLKQGIALDVPAEIIGYQYGEKAGVDILAIRAASLGQILTKQEQSKIMVGASQIFPLVAQDFMPALQGPMLGRALKDAKDRWLTSGFSLTKSDLLAQQFSKDIGSGEGG